MRRVLLMSITFFLLASSTAGAQEAPLYALPGALVDTGSDAITLRVDGREHAYVPGIGWQPHLDAPPPVVTDGVVYVGAAVLDALGVRAPRLERVRVAGDVEVRIVLDVPDLDAAMLEGLRKQGSVQAGEVLEFTLPPLLVPAGVPEDVGGVAVDVVADEAGTRLRLSGPAFRYDVFPLAYPTRLVLDVLPRRDLDVAEVDEQVAPGVRYQRILAPTREGGSVVHLVHISGGGEFRVVGGDRTPRTVRDLASGGVVAINAGYFDTTTFQAIGYLLVDHGLVSLPSRNRASIAFGPNGTIIDRLRADVRLHTTYGRIEVGGLGDGGVSVVTAPGALAGPPDRGVLVVQDGRVLENKVGPRRVPDDGYALVYPPDLRELALLDHGDAVILDTRLEPAAFESARYAVEAGPLLIKDGLVAYEPAVEGFASGQRILDGLTQQAAVGVMDDGAVILVVAETMRAADLVKLFQWLGAKDAMRLDSGSSTTLLVNGQVVNRATERRVASAIIYVLDAPDTASGH
jgi:hypothetical protein